MTFDEEYARWLQHLYDSDFGEFLVLDVYVRGWQFRLADSFRSFCDTLIFVKMLLETITMER